ncbi:MAG TPA: adenosylcobinamide amidohydrolase [Negativicutes bacterium]|nr:adenosylcobinamide amidohydrolase [Negativicutes bacterium]
MKGTDTVEEILLHTLSLGDEVVWRPANQSISVSFKKPRKVLSTSLQNGGYHEGLTGIFNHNCGPDDGSHPRLRAATYQEHMRVLARGAGLDPDKTTGMGTAARMENVAIAVKEYRELVVTAIATAGVEGNGGRVGDPASHYDPVEKSPAPKLGTINIMLIMDADMSPGTLARALVTCTEAKTAALQELMVGSLYSTGLATGSGTDQTIVLANPQSPLYFEGAGKHNKLGELIGLAVMQAVKEALLKQNWLSAEKQHSVLRRMWRFGVTEEALWQDYLAAAVQPMDKESFMQSLRQWERDPQAVVQTSLYVHLLDQLQWGLLSPEEVCACANDLLQLCGYTFGTAAPAVRRGEVALLVTAWQRMILACLAAQQER